MAERTSSSDTPWLNSACGFNPTRTAGRELPPTLTSPTPLICEMVCASWVDAKSYSCPCEYVSEVSVRIMIGASDGLALR